MKINPLKDNILIQVVGESSVRSSGIIIPASAFKKDVPHIGIVCETGPDIGDSVKIGDSIIFEKFSGEAIKMDGIEYSIINSISVLAVVGKDDGE